MFLLPQISFTCKAIYFGCIDNLQHHLKSEVENVILTCFSCLSLHKHSTHTCAHVHAQLTTRFVLSSQETKCAEEHILSYDSYWILWELHTLVDLVVCALMICLVQCPVSCLPVVFMLSWEEADECSCM